MMTVFTSTADLGNLSRGREWPGVPTGNHVGFCVVVTDGDFRAVNLHNGEWFAAKEGEQFAQVTSLDLISWLEAVSEPRPAVVVGFTPAGFPILEQEQPK